MTELARRISGVFIGVRTELGGGGSGSPLRPIKPIAAPSVLVEVPKKGQAARAAAHARAAELATRPLAAPVHGALLARALRFARVLVGAEGIAGVAAEKE